MRILVASAIDPSQNWAYAINTFAMAHGFAQCGHEVTIICWRPDKGAWSDERLARHYGHQESIRWVQLPQNVAGRALDGHWHFALMALPSLMFIRPDVVFSRSYIFPWLSSQLGFPTVVESHAYPDDPTPPFLRLVRGTSRKAFRLWVTGADNLAASYQQRGVPEKKLVVLPSGGSLDLFEPPDDLPSTPYPEGGPIIAYTGHLYDYKGIPTVLEAAERLPEAQFHLIGGWPEDVQRHAARVDEMGLANVTFHGLKSLPEVPAYLWHADVLLLPPSAQHPSAAWTAPIKLAEYMASGTPIVATDILGARNWVSDAEVEFVTADDSEAMASGIQAVLSGGERIQRRRERCREKARAFSYPARAEAILERVG